MAQHFLLSRPAKSLSLAQVFRMSDAEAEAIFAKVRWPETNGAPVCPSCGGLNAYDCRRPNGAPRFRCRACKTDFSLQWDAFCLAQAPAQSLSRGHCDLLQRGQRQVRARHVSRSWPLLQDRLRSLHKLREAMAEELKGRMVGGEGKVAEVDGGYFGGYVKPRNLAENRAIAASRKTRHGKRKVVVIVRERDGNSVPAVFRTEGQAQSWIKARIAKGTVVNADEASSWDGLHGSLRNEAHQPSRGLFARRRLHELGGGIFQPATPRRGWPLSPYRGRVPASLRAESSWREDYRRVSTAIRRPRRRARDDKRVRRISRAIGSGT